MQTRSRAKGTSPQTPSSAPKRSSKQTPNGSIASSSSSSSRNKASDKAVATPQVNGDKNKAQNTPVKRRSSISRASAATWHFIVRKWEIPRKTLHVSIGMCPYPWPIAVLAWKMKANVCQDLFVCGCICMDGNQEMLLRY